MESKIEDQNAIIYTKTDEIENWKSDLVLHVRTKLVKSMLMADIVDINIVDRFHQFNLCHQHPNILTNYSKISV